MGERSCISLVSLLEKKSEKNPDFPLYTFIQGNLSENKILTYGELAEKAKKIACVLQKVTHPGDRVLIIYPPGLELIAAFFGCLYAGVIVVPVYPPSTKELVAKLQHIIQNSEANVVITTQAILQQIKKLRLAKWLSRTHFLHKISEQIVGPSFNRRLQLSEWDLEKMHFIATDNLPKGIAEWQSPSLTEDDIAFLQYTSGSTGKPKGVMVSHGNLLHNLYAIEKRHQIVEGDLGVSWLPPYHDMGLIGGILQPLYSNVAVKLMSPLTFLQRPAIWLEAISHYQATGIVAPNFAYDLCVTKVTEKEKRQLDLSSLKVAMSGAEPIRHTTIERFVDCFAPCGFQSKVFFPCYGLAESTLMVTGVDCYEGANTKLVDNKELSKGNVVFCDETNNNARRLINCGRPLADFHLAIVNPDTLVECPDRVVGEIWVASKSVAQGYWRLPKETKHCFKAHLDNDEHAYLRTGDLGYVDQGSLYVTGRLKDIIIIRGRNYYPHDLEHTLQQCHRDLRINCCAVFSLEEGDHELLVVVQEVKEESKSLNLEEVIKKIRSQILRDHGIAVDIVVLAGRKAVPKTTSGKIQRLLCKKRYLEGTMKTILIDKSPPHETAKGLPTYDDTTKILDANPSDIAQLLAPIFNTDITTLDTGRKLSELGLNSMQLIEFQYVISTHTHCNISLEFLLMDPCLDEIIDLLAGKIDLSKLTQDNQVDLNLEFDKYKEIVTDISSLPRPVPQHALLTGATGFLGAYLLHELLVNTSWQITCLVQADSLMAGMTRVVKNLENYNLWQPAYQERIKVILGNLEKTKLGISEPDWEHLAQDIDLIFHSAAVLNFIYPYQKLMVSNVLGTKQLLDLAGYKHLKAFHYVSTVGYFMSADLADDVVVSEQMELNPVEGIYGGYNQTKWLAEKLVLNARKHNISTAIYRPSLITGESQTGCWNPADVVCRILKGCIQLGVRPILDINLNFVPVDYVAKSIVHFAKEKPYRNDTFHLTNPTDVVVEQMFGYVNDNGFKIEAVDYLTWEEMLRESNGKLLDSSFAPLRPFFTEKVSTKNTSLFDLYINNNKAKIDCTYTKAKLATHEIHCKQVDKAMLNKYLNYLIDCGYLTQ